MEKIAYGGNARLTPEANDYYKFSGWEYKGTPIDEGTHTRLISGVETVTLDSNGVIVLQNVTQNVIAEDLVAKFESTRQIDVDAGVDPQEGGTVNVSAI